MYDRPNTRPDEIKRLSEVARDPERFNIEVLLYIQESRQWRYTHEREDDRRFNELKLQLENQGGVVSGITEDRSELKGGWKLLTILSACAISVGAIVAAWLKK
jgi:hypothetical protein